MDSLVSWSKPIKGVVAGAVATAALSLLMVTPALGQETATIAVLDRVAGFLLHGLGYEPIPRLAGWLWHFFIGTVWWGILFSLLRPILPGLRCWVKGLSFGVGAGLLMLLMVMPLTAAGALGTDFNLLDSLMLVPLHMVYGVILGTVYGWLVPRQGYGDD
jgi:hypothetical protein